MSNARFFATFLDLHFKACVVYLQFTKTMWDHLGSFKFVPLKCSRNATLSFSNFDYYKTLLLLRLQKSPYKELTYQALRLISSLFEKPQIFFCSRKVLVDSATLCNLWMPFFLQLRTITAVKNSALEDISNSFEGVSVQFEFYHFRSIEFYHFSNVSLCKVVCRFFLKSQDF